MLYARDFAYATGLAALADAQLSLGAAGIYAVFAASTITNTGSTTIGDFIGLAPGTSITGFPPGISLGQDINNGNTTQAKLDIQALYTALAALLPTSDLTGEDLGGRTLTPGVYSFSASGALTGSVTLDGQGDANAVFVLQFASALTTATGASVVLVNGAQACNVYWQVGSSATLGAGTAFAGIVVAQASITADAGSSLVGGGLYALTAAVTLDSNVVDLRGACGVVVGAPPPPPPPPGYSSAATLPPTASTAVTTRAVPTPLSITPSSSPSDVPTGSPVVTSSSLTISPSTVPPLSLVQASPTSSSTTASPTLTPSTVTLASSETSDRSRSAFVSATSPTSLASPATSASARPVSSASAAESMVVSTISVSATCAGYTMMTEATCRPCRTEARSLALVPGKG